MIPDSGFRIPDFRVAPVNTPMRKKKDKGEHVVSFLASEVRNTSSIFRSSN